MIIRYSAILLSVLMISACSAPMRGESEWTPVRPVYVYGPDQHTDSIYQQGTAMMLHEDLKARRVGDMLTVTLEEKTDAEKTAETDTRKDTDVSITDPTLLGRTVTSGGQAIFPTDIDTAHAFSGTGDTSQSNSLTGSITVNVVEVLSNGNLVVQGEKWININQGEDYVRLRGIIRPIDVNPDNTISSTRIANADIRYGGDGVLNDSNSMGWLTRFFNSSWMPF